MAKIEQKMLSYAEHRAEGVISAQQHRELSTRLQDEKSTLTEEQLKLATKAQRLQEAREMLAYVEPVARKMAEKMKDLTDEEKAIVIRAACRRIWLDGQNEIEIELYLPGLEALASNGLPRAPQDNTPSPQPESGPSDGSPEALSDTTNDSRQGGLSNKARCKPVEYRPSLPTAQVLESYPLRW